MAGWRQFTSTPALKPAAQGKTQAMHKSLLTLTASAFLLATTMGAAQSQSTDDDTMQGQRTEQGQSGESMKKGHEGKKKYDKHRDRHADMMRRHHGGMGMGMGQGMMDRGMGGGMGHRAMMQVVFAMMDADGNGTLSLQEVQDAHARIFAHMDADDDGEVTKGEIKAFFHGGKDRRGSSRRDRSERSDDRDDADDLNLTDEVDGDDNNDDN
jgi:hypothetical protein